MKPNVLIMIADDATYSDLTLYGGQNTEEQWQAAKEGRHFARQG